MSSSDIAAVATCETSYAQALIGSPGAGRGKKRGILHDLDRRLSGNRQSVVRPGEPTGTLTPDPVGKTVIFQPTMYFGSYLASIIQGVLMQQVVKEITISWCSSRIPNRILYTSMSD